MRVTVDAVVFGWGGESLEVLLVERRWPPFSGSWALPGGFVLEGESLDEAVRRELSEETGLSKVYLEQLYTFGEVERDPRERIVSVAYYALVRLPQPPLHADTDARAAAWFPVSEVPALAFDHRRILDVALARLKGKVRWQPIGFELLPPKFKLSQLQRLYEVILERPLDKRNFRKKILAMPNRPGTRRPSAPLLVPLPETERDVAHRAARLYRFDARRYRSLLKEGFSFEI